MVGIHRDQPTFIVDSSDRISGSHDYFTTHLHIKPNNNYDMCSLIHCSIPNTFYNVDIQNNQITIRENGIEKTGSLPPANYTNDSLSPAYVDTLANIEFLLNALSISIDAVNPWTYTLAWSEFFSKWTLIVASVAGRPMLADSGLYFDVNQLNNFFGFHDEVFYPYTILGLVGDIISVILPKMDLTSYITLKSNLTTNDGNNDPDSSVLLRMPFRNTIFNDVITYDLIQLEDGAKRIANNKSNIYTFGIYDDHDRPMRMNGRPWYFTLFMYEHNILPLKELKIIEDAEIKKQQDKERSIETKNPDMSLDILSPVPTIVDIQE